MLAQDDISALQVKNRDGEWIHADPIPVPPLPRIKRI